MYVRKSVVSPADEFLRFGFRANCCSERKDRKLVHGRNTGSEIHVVGM
jgi:hypothetical protein